MAKLLKLFIKGVIIILPQPNRRLAAGAVPSSQAEERYDGVAPIEGECAMVSVIMLDSGVLQFRIEHTYVYI